MWLHSSPKFGAECLSLRLCGLALELGTRVRLSNIILALGLELGLGAPAIELVLWLELGQGPYAKFGFRDQFWF